MYSRQCFPEMQSHAGGVEKEKKRTFRAVEVEEAGLDGRGGGLDDIIRGVLGVCGA